MIAAEARPSLQCFELQRPPQRRDKVPDDHRRHREKAAMVLQHAEIGIDDLKVAFALL
jgi:hypothetical protein